MEKVSNEKHLRIAKINGVFGLGGWVKLYPYASFDQLGRLKKVILADENTGEVIREVTVTELNTASGKARIKLKEASTPEDAEKLTGLEIWVERAKFKLNKGEYPIQDILGCDVSYKGEIIGKVEGVYSLAQDVLEVTLKDNKTVMIPVVDDFVIDIDTEKRLIVVDRVDELL